METAIATNNGKAAVMRSDSNIPEHKRPTPLTENDARVRISTGENWVFAFADKDNRVTGRVIDRIEGPNGQLYLVSTEKACEVVSPNKKDDSGNPMPFVVPAGTIVHVGASYDIKKELGPYFDSDEYVWVEIWYREKIKFVASDGERREKWQTVIDIKRTGQKRMLKAKAVADADVPF